MASVIIEITPKSSWRTIEMALKGFPKTIEMVPKVSLEGHRDGLSDHRDGTEVFLQDHRDGLSDHRGGAKSVPGGP